MSTAPHTSSNTETVVELARSLRAGLEGGLHDRVAGSLYRRAAQVAQKCVRFHESPKVNWDLLADEILTSRVFGFPIMIVGLGVILWLTIAGSNVPSSLLASAFFWMLGHLETAMNAVGSPWWLTGFFVDGVLLGLAWVVSVMFPPMAIFFPIFTLLEDIGYLPRVAFNLDRLFRWCGAHGKQALSMGMGFGCNAAGVVSTRIIDSPRERLIAILTNNFMLCNGRWPTIIMLATVFIAAAFPAAWSSVIATGSVVAVTLLGVVATFAVSKVLSGTVLRGEPSHFYLELPPYRVPNVGRVMYRSLIDRTIFVLGRACVTAVPAGAVIWLLGNIDVSGASLMAHLTGWLNPVGWLLGLDGVILLAYIIAIPANEIVVPTIIMGYMAASRMTELEDMGQLRELFLANGWTFLTAICLMLFCLLHYPCATTTWTIYRETRSWKWTLWANLMPLLLAVVVCAAVAQVSRLVF